MITSPTSPGWTPRVSSLRLDRCIFGRNIPGWMRTSLTSLMLIDSVVLHDTNSWAFLFDPSSPPLQSLTSLYLDWSIGVNYYSDPLDRDIHSTSLMHLSLEFYCDHENTVLDALTALHLPALTHLIIYGSHGDNISTICKHWFTLSSPQPTLPDVAHVGKYLREWESCFEHLERIEVWPLGVEVDAVYEELQGVVRSWKSERVPMLVLPPHLYQREVKDSDD
ncbi:hypothetical protein FB45DRAFT_1062413 [Roridomyces roridus]|uniref:Uncharacterized protein n=1 Tax=Roridomyces roridus TaxID=1738132 RepID=A0AAD7BHU4_9AGAR|nr:hypothetical protein FB45DRAFT_1062413 [Roridomyces roridus]